MVQVSRKAQQPKVWVNGQYMPANKSGDGTWYVEIDGKRVKVDPNDLFGMNNHWENLDKSFEERKSFHAKWKEHWLALQQKASCAYSTAIGTYKEASKKYNEVTQGLKISELRGTQLKEAKEYQSQMTSAGAQKRRATSDSIFYGRLAVDEAYNIQDYTNLQALAGKMSQA